MKVKDDKSDAFGGADIGHELRYHVCARKNTPRLTERANLVDCVTAWSGMAGYL